MRAEFSWIDADAFHPCGYGTNSMYFNLTNIVESGLKKSNELMKVENSSSKIIFNFCEEMFNNEQLEEYKLPSFCPLTNNTAYYIY